MLNDSFLWEVQPQEKKGTYRFTGSFHVTKGVLDSLSREEISIIYHITQALVRKFGGLDYLLVFKHKDTRKEVWLIDQLNDEMKREFKDYKENDICTLCYPEER